MHYIYKIFNKLNNKAYIGQTNNTIQRWAQHRSAAKLQSSNMVITRAMIKYGIENFDFQVIASAKNLDDVNLLEEDCIVQYDTRNPLLGYNVDSGGNNLPRSEEVKRKVAEGIKKFHLNNPGVLKGKKRSEETKRKMSEAAMGKAGTNAGKKFDEEWRLKISKSQIGSERKNARRFSEETEKEICRQYVEEEKSIYELGKCFKAPRSLIITILDRSKIERRKNNYTGHSNGRNIFNLDEEKIICEDYLAGKVSMALLAKKYKCGKTTIRQILLRNKVNL